jgi:hypothetical protein
MRTPLATLTLTLALSLAGLASADVYKCPAPGGKTIYQDAPCSVETEPLLRTDPEALPDSPHATTDQTCTQLGSFAHSLALLRDAGTPASFATAKMAQAAAKTGGAEGRFWEDLTRNIILQVYSNRWWSPAVAQQRIETTCLVARERRP